MKTFIIIVLLAAVLYYSGVVKWLLIACFIPEKEQPAPDAVQENKKEVIPDQFKSISRLELEELAAGKLKAMKIKQWYFISRTADTADLIDLLNDN